MGISKLDVAQRYIGKDKPKHLLHLARENTRSQLIDLLHEEYDEDKETVKSEKMGPIVWVKCPGCGKRWRQEIQI